MEELGEWSRDGGALARLGASTRQGELVCKKTKRERA
jgi:hypothetical protein